MTKDMAEGLTAYLTTGAGAEGFKKKAGEFLGIGGGDDTTATGGKSEKSFNIAEEIDWTAIPGFENVDDDLIAATSQALVRATATSIEEGAAALNLDDETVQYLGNQFTKNAQKGLGVETFTFKNKGLRGREGEMGEYAIPIPFMDEDPQAFNFYFGNHWTGGFEEPYWTEYFEESIDDYIYIQEGGCPGIELPEGEDWTHIFALEGYEYGDCDGLSQVFGRALDKFQEFKESTTW
jgi:hypothetical protein